MLKLLGLFLRLGVTSFGGPAAHVAMMEEEFVHRRQWLTREKFLDLIALTNLIPGPNSTELAIHIGYQRAGWRGFWIAGLGFILPAFFIVLTVAYFYVHFGSLPEVGHFLAGVKVVVLAIIALACERFFRTSFKIQAYRELIQKAFWQNKKNFLNLFILIASFYLHQRGFSEVSILLNCAFVSMFLSRNFRDNEVYDLGALFWIFFKIGSLLFGSGYVLLSFLKAELIDHRALISQSLLLDAISVGQFTPGPVFTTATFIGYVLNGFAGAFVATAGIFLPAFLFVAVSIPLYHKMEKSHLLRDLLDGLVLGSLGLLFMTSWTFSQTTLNTLPLLLLFLLSLGLLGRFKIPPTLLILLGGIVGLIL